MYWILQDQEIPLLTLLIINVKRAYSNNDFFFQQKHSDNEV